jgi:Zn-finger nucleic acid-binding protein
MKCPSCHAASLHGLGAGGVELDMCGTCGGCYLDADEVNAFIGTGRSKGWSATDSLITLLLGASMFS